MIFRERMFQEGAVWTHSPEGTGSQEANQSEGGFLPVALERWKDKGDLKRAIFINSL